MFLRKIKVGMIVKVKPSNSLVKVLGFVDAKKESYWLRVYWQEKHNINLRETFKVIRVIFTSSTKEYYYPVLRKCVTIPLRQKKYKIFFENLKTFITPRYSKFFDEYRKDTFDFKDLDERLYRAD